MIYLNISKIQFSKMWADPMIFMFILIQPIIFSFLFGLLFSIGGGSVELGIFVGVAEMSIWQVFLYSGGVIVRHEFNIDKTIPFTLISTFNQLKLWITRLAVCLLLSIPALFICILIGAMYFHINITFEDLMIVGGGLIIFLFSLFCLGLPIIILLFLNPYGGKVIQSISYPIFLLSGMIISTEHLPSYIQTIAYIFPITWSTNLIKNSLNAGSIDLLSVIPILIISLLYLFASLLLYKFVMKRVQNTGEVKI